MDGADAEVVHAAGAAEADFAEAVDVIITDAVVGIVAMSRWGGLDGGGISMGRGGAMERTMRSDLVVDAGEAVELGLQLAMMAAAGGAASQAAPAATLGPDEGVKPFDTAPSSLNAEQQTKAEGINYCARMGWRRTGTTGS
jgi:hypothetical protein